MQEVLNSPPESKWDRFKARLGDFAYNMSIAGSTRLPNRFGDSPYIADFDPQAFAKAARESRPLLEETEIDSTQG